MMTVVYIVIGIVVFFVLLALILGSTKSAQLLDLPPNAKDKDIVALVKEGKKIQAIKWYRELHNVGLKEAKEAVDRMEEKLSR
jgi:ribosomal protein L7/L12